MPQQKPLNQPELRDLLDLFKNEIMKGINCVQIGIIQSFDSQTQSATIQLALKKVINISLDGIREVSDYPVLLQCPIMILSGGSSALTFPIAQGDTCIVLFNDREIDNWYVNGGIQTPSTPRLHDKSDALAIVGIRNTQNAISNYFNGTRLSHDANTHIDFTAGKIDLYGDVTIHGTLSTVDGRGTIVYNTHIHDGVMPGSGNSGEPVV